MAEFQQMYEGYWCLLIKSKKPKEEIYSTYRQHNTAEIFYDSFKNDLNGDRITDHMLESYEGKYKPIYSTPSKLQAEII